MKAPTRNNSVRVPNPAERRRRFEELIRESIISPAMPLAAGAFATTPVDGDSVHNVLIAPPSSTSEPCVTQTLHAISKEHAGGKDRIKAIDVPSVEEARTSPISVLLTCRAQTPPREKKYRAKLHATAAAAYAAYYEIERRYALWKDFVEVANASQATKHSIRTGKDRPKALLLVMRFVFGWSHDYDRAYKLARGLELCQLRKVRPENILQELERKGIDKLYRTACKELPYLGKTAKEKALLRMDYEPAAADDPFADLDDGSNSKNGAEPISASTKSELKRDGANVLYIEVTDEQLSTILESPEHQLLSLWFESAGTLHDGFRRFVAVKVAEVETSDRTLSD
ncbi:hypothetical protein [Mesorhizobium sp. B2-3-15]|uniref:hypothetical protein n=1 Tax=Mesorhizobium sp. B2-3-15 TaxID=2589949 RepID=UPI00112B801C|nr:hypothetical protein [Mesorhizobium sp. B2-3-15]TPL72309.1 hypothetical protein FJ954_16580 [Mesorhizobium sp. B2-3-15]